MAEEEFLFSLRMQIWEVFKSEFQSESSHSRRRQVSQKFISRKRERERDSVD